jgi:hypothetical protein
VGSGPAIAVRVVAALVAVSALSACGDSGARKTATSAKPTAKPARGEEFRVWRQQASALCTAAFSEIKALPDPNAVVAASGDLLAKLRKLIVVLGPVDRRLHRLVEDTRRLGSPAGRDGLVRAWIAVLDERADNLTATIRATRTVVKGIEQGRGAQLRPEIAALVEITKRDREIGSRLVPIKGRAGIDCGSE